MQAIAPLNALDATGAVAVDMQHFEWTEDPGSGQICLISSDASSAFRIRQIFALMPSVKGRFDRYLVSMVFYNYHQIAAD